MISDILNALKAAKEDTAAAIAEKGGSLQPGDGFADFPAAIRALAASTPSAALENPASQAEILSGFQALDSDGSPITGTLKIRTGSVIPEANVSTANKVDIEHGLGETPLFIMIWTTESLKNISDITWPVYWGATSYIVGADSYSKSVIAYYDSTSDTIKYSASNAPTNLATGINQNKFTWTSHVNANYGWPAGILYHWLVVGG